MTSHIFFTLFLTVNISPHDCQITTVEGTVLHGRIRVITPEAVLLTSSYGELKIPLAHVEKLTTTTPLYFYLSSYRLSFVAPVTGYSKGLEVLFTTKGAIPLSTLFSARSEPLKTLRTDINIGFGFTAGNVNLQNWTLELVLHREKTIHNLSLSFYTSYSRTDGTTTSNYQRAAFDYHPEVLPLLLLSGNATAERDGVAGLDIRSTTSVQAGWYIFKQNGRQLSLGGGPAYYHEDYRGAPPTREARLHMSIQGVWNGSLASLEGDVNTYTSLQRITVFFIQSTLNIKTHITSSISLFFSIIETYNNAPPEDLKKNDIRLSAGISVHL